MESKRRVFTDEHREKLRAATLGKRRSVESISKQVTTCANRPNKEERIHRNVFTNNLRKYKLTVQAFAMLWLKADGKCENPGCRRALDLDKKSWAIDHDHSCCPGARTCGRCTRGLLCSQCNVALGYLGDSESKALGLVEYLHLTSNHRRESGT